MAGLGKYASGFSAEPRAADYMAEMLRQSNDLRALGAPDSGSAIAPGLARIESDGRDGKRRRPLKAAALRRYGVPRGIRTPVTAVKGM
jgi:hypothetical protein